MVQTVEEAIKSQNLKEKMQDRMGQLELLQQLERFRFTYCLTAEIDERNIRGIHLDSRGAELEELSIYPLEFFKK